MEEENVMILGNALKEVDKNESISKDVKQIKAKLKHPQSMILMGYDKDIEIQNVEVERDKMQEARDLF